jgi:hypothetical protein
MSVTTLEEVFIKVAEGSANEATAEAGKKAEYTPVDLESVERVPIVFDKLDDDQTTQLFFKHVYGLLIKRVLYSRRDIRTMIFQLFIPVIFVLIGMIVMYVTVPNTDQPEISLTYGMFNSGNTNRLPTPYASATTFCADYGSTCTPATVTGSGQSTIMNSVTSALSFPVIPITTATLISDVSQYVYDHRDDYASAQFGAVSFQDTTPTSLSYFIHPNYTGVHAGPLFSRIVAEGALKQINSGHSLSTSIHPLPSTYRQNEILSNYNVQTVVTFILLAIPFVSAGFVTFIVREVEIRAKVN